MKARQGIHAQLDEPLPLGVCDRRCTVGTGDGMVRASGEEVNAHANQIHA